MKLQIDTSRKTISLEEQVNLGDLFETLETLLPNGLWKQYSLIPNSTLTWSNPIYIYPNTYEVPNTNPVWEWPTVTCGSSGASIPSSTTTSHIYNVETK